MIRRTVFLLILAVGAFACACHYFPVFVLHKVQVEGALPGQSQKYADLLSADPGANLLSLDLASWSKRIQADPAVSRVHVRTSLSGTVEAQIELEKPVFLLDTRPVCGLSDEGVMLPLLYHAPDNRLVLISGVGGESKYYQRAWSRKIRTAKAFERAWTRQFGLDAPLLSEIHVTPDDEVDAYLWPDRLLIRMGRGSWQEPMKTLKPILNHLAASERILDLRFEGQVVETIQGET